MVFALKMGVSQFPTGVSQLLEVKPHPYHHFEVQNSLNDWKRYLGYNLVDLKSSQ